MPRKLQRRLLPLAIILSLTAGVVGVAVDARGGWVNALGLPPALEASTPAAQNGFTLLALQAPGGDMGCYRYEIPQGTGGSYSVRPQTLDAVETGDTAGGAWISLPAGSSYTKSDFTVTGRAATGETFPLDFTLDLSSAWGQYLFTALPGGYPDTLRYMDLTLRSRLGQTAHWRITRLPRMRHVNPPPDVQDTFDQSGTRLTLQATRQPYRNRPGAYIRCRLSPAVAPHAHQWEWDTGGDKARTDWESFPRGAKEESTMMPLTGPAAQQEIAFNHGAIQEDFIQNPFVADDHFVTVSGTVTQFETYEERLTFHDVRAEQDEGVFTVTRAQTHTTPSGISVTLPAQSRATFMQGETLVEPGLLLDVQPSVALNTLDRSPLAQIYHKPVRVSLDFVKPLDAGIQTIGPGSRRKYSLYVPGRKPVLLRTLTVIVRQRVDLQSWPVSMTAPIRDTTNSLDGLVPVPPEGLHP